MKLLFAYKFTTLIRVISSAQGTLNLTLICRKDEHFFLEDVTSSYALLCSKAQTQLKIPGWGQDRPLVSAMFVLSLPSLLMF